MLRHMISSPLHIVIMVALMAAIMVALMMMMMREKPSSQHHCYLARPWSLAHYEWQQL